MSPADTHISLLETNDNEIFLLLRVLREVQKNMHQRNICFTDPNVSQKTQERTPLHPLLHKLSELIFYFAELATKMFLF
jgi:hypothetical protein